MNLLKEGLYLVRERETSTRWVSYVLAILDWRVEQTKTKHKVRRIYRYNFDGTWKRYEKFDSLYANPCNYIEEARLITKGDFQWELETQQNQSG